MREDEIDFLVEKGKSLLGKNLMQILAEAWPVARKQTAKEIIRLILDDMELYKDEYVHQKELCCKIIEKYEIVYVESEDE